MLAGVLGAPVEKLAALAGEKLKADKTRKKLEEIWTASRGEAHQDDELKLEVALIERSAEREIRFKVLESGD